MRSRNNDAPKRPIAKRAEQFTNLPLVKEATELLTFLMEKGSMSRNKAKSLLTHRSVLVNKTITTAYNYELKPGMLVQVSKNHQQKEFKSRLIKLVYEDAYLIVIEKKEGIAAVSSERKREKTVYDILTEYIQRSSKQRRIYGVHKLDKQASGLMIFAKDERTKENLQENWSRLFRKRTMVAITEGYVEKDNGVVSSWVVDEKVYVVQAAPAKATDEKAITHYTTIKRMNGYSLMELELKNGRKEQTRVHMHDIGHPIVGDQNAENPIKRLALHAFRLQFQHPVTGEMLHFEIPYPTAFRQLVQQQPDNANQ